ISAAPSGSAGGSTQNDLSAQDLATLSSANLGGATLNAASTSTFEAVAVNNGASQPTQVLVTSQSSSSSTQAAATADGVAPADGSSTGIGLTALQNGTDAYSVYVSPLS